MKTALYPLFLHTLILNNTCLPFFRWYPANSSYPAMLGDMLSSALGIIGFSWNGSPAATELETVGWGLCRARARDS